MKSERRNEPKVKAAEPVAQEGTNFFAAYGSRLLLGAVLFVLVYVLVRNHYQAKADRLERSSQAMGSAIYSLNQLKSLSPMASPEQLAGNRRELSRSVEDAVRLVLDTAEDPKVKARAWLIRGDANLLLAGFAEAAPAATPPGAGASSDRSHDDLVKAAEDAYTQALSSSLTPDAQTISAAKFGLAYVAEDKGDWDKAKTLLQQIADDASQPAEVKLLAIEEESKIATIQTPVLLVKGAEPPPPAPASMPATRSAPSVLGPSLPPSLIQAGPSAAPATTLPAAAASSTTQPATVTPPAAPAATSPAGLLSPDNGPSVAPNAAPATRP